MSSVVNKSSTRFAPKVANRGPGRKQPSRRTSTIRASFSVPKEDSEANRRPLLDTKADIDESAIDDSEPAPQSALATPPSSAPKLPSGSMEAPPRSVNTRASASAAPQPLRLTTISEPLTRQRRLNSTRATAFAPIVAPMHKSTPPSSQVAAPPVVEPVSKPKKAVVREKQFDEQGREVIEPEDLPRVGRGFAPSDDTSENKAINPHTFTMANLCQDIPIGQQNEDYDRFEDARMSRKRKRARVLRAKQMMRGQYDPKKPELRKELEDVYREYMDERQERFGNSKEESQARLQAIDAEPTQRQTVQLQKSKDGTILLDQESQQLDRHANNKAEDTPVSTREIDRYSTIINSYSFSTKERQERWTEAETLQFYQALSVWGTDFNLISHMFPTRSRHQIKTKFKYEEKRNPTKVQLYLVHRRKVDIVDYAKISGTEIVKLEDLEQDLERVRAQHNEQLKVKEDMKLQAKAEDAQRQLTANSVRPRGIKRER